MHCHILPQLDDGAKDMQISLQMCQQAVRNGITDIIATPHHLRGDWYNPGTLVNKHVAALNTELQKLNIPLTVYPGQEIRIHEQLLSKLQKGDAIPLANGPYILLELPSSVVPLYATSLIFQLVQSGYKPIIAHPERNRAIQEDPEKLAQLIELGAFSQLTWKSLSLTSRFKKTSRVLIQKDLIHFISTDAHDCINRSINDCQQKKRILSPTLKMKIQQYEKNAYHILNKSKRAN